MPFDYHSGMNSRELLHVFVYGTLKCGHENHRRFCGGYVAVEKATVRGRLYLLVDKGYLILVVPESSIVRHGTSNIAADIEKTKELGKAIGEQSNWDLIEGEIITFDDPLDRLPRLDELESFHPDGSGEYVRVLLWTELPESRLVWTYIAPHGWKPEKNCRIGCRFPESSCS
jgi:gamma-glutamylcyclotransferase (GGCT)/AIG2-like uncharacterized protein YtfP